MAMLGGREKMGAALGIDWRLHVFGKGKYRRKTFGFGDYDKKRDSYSGFEIYVRELSILEGGIGCAVWDASVIQARWIYAHPEMFEGKYVIELGSGCGLPGLVIGKFADTALVTDYLPQLVQNLDYNIKLNSGEFSADDEDGDRRLGDRTYAAFLDWKDVSLDGTEFSDPEPEDVKKERLEAEAAEAANVEERSSDDELSEGTLEEQERMRNINQDKLYHQCADILIGSELTYSGSISAVYALLRVLLFYLKPGGVFYEILSDDRDGVHYFLEKVQELGFTYKAVPVEDQYMGKTGTGQQAESYHFYTFWRPAETDPHIME